MRGPWVQIFLSLILVKRSKSREFGGVKVLQRSVRGAVTEKEILLMKRIHNKKSLAFNTLKFINSLFLFSINFLQEGEK